MLQIKSLILNSLLLVLEILLTFGLDIGHKQDGFSKTLIKKSLKFVPNRREGTIAFNLSFVLLLAKVDPIPEEQDCKRDVLVARGTGCIKIVFALLTEVIIFYMQVFLVQIRVPGLKNSILEGDVYLIMFLAFNKQF